MDLVLVSTNPVLAMFKHCCQNLEKVLLNAAIFILHLSGVQMKTTILNSPLAFYCLLLKKIHEVWNLITFELVDNVIMLECNYCYMLQL